MGCKHQVNTMQFWVDYFFILHSAVIWISQRNVFFFISISFLTQIVQELSRESAAFSVYINSSYFVFVADGFFNQMVKVSSNGAKEDADACRTRAPSQ